MLDRHLEPDDEPFEDEDIEEPDFDFDDETSEEDMAVAEFNYECLVYGEPERRIAWRR